MSSEEDSLQDPKRFQPATPPPRTSNDTQQNHPRYHAMANAVNDRRHSMSNRIHKGFSFFSRRFASQRKKIVAKFALNYFIMAVGILGIFSIYWGSFYNIDDRVKNMKNLVVIDDDTTIDGMPPYFGQTLLDVVQSPRGRSRGDWNVYNITEFRQLAADNNRTMLDQIAKLIHDEKYWTSLYIPANATINYYNAVMQGNGDYNISGNGVISIYESARHSFGMSIWGLPALQTMEDLWLTAQTQMVGKIFQNATISTQTQFELVGTPLQFRKVDNVQYNLAIYVGPFHDGIIYLTILSIMNLDFFGPLNMAVANLGIKRSHFLIFRYFSSVISFFFMSLCACLVTLAFQVPLTISYGRGGFMVYWMVTFLDMWALGAINEIIGMILLTIYPPLLQFWVLFIIIINITPTFTPIGLLPKFFRYGYAMPSHNYYEAIKTIFFKTTRRQLGRNIPILVVWFTTLSIAFPVVTIYYLNAMEKQERKKVCKVIEKDNQPLEECEP
ncbi:Nitrosoguanidine resistance protein SNG1 [Candida viswanathii]|uniref:Nitrosoguanidine resistance protein SNG1 n=1 Tax=Candida viswanathii TaxID=5486 RepID=A0A367YBF8_9ASCO|nr:Nitrosoguanidine resistance protein SNG1 [Candida viswanathii]